MPFGFGVRIKDAWSRALDGLGFSWGLASSHMLLFFEAA